jgi:addiction module RelB/DinJ family antitoxin
MSVIFRCRVDPKKLKRATQVTSELGTSVPEVIRIFLAEIARTGKVPVRMSLQAESDLLLDKEARNKLWRELDDAEGW